MSDVWACAGFDVQSLLGDGHTGQVWRARELATGAAVALRRLGAGADPDAIDALRREAAVLCSLDTPYLVRLRAVVGGDVDTVLVHDLAAGGSLARLLARRGRLDPGEVVTIAAPLAQALAVVHARGLVHADVTPSNVLFTAEGMPLLSGLGLARLAPQAPASADGVAAYVDPAVAAGALPDAAADVWSLAAVCKRLLGEAASPAVPTADHNLTPERSASCAPLGLRAPSAPEPLVAEIEAALHLDRSLRPDAAAFAAALRRSHPAAPVRLTGDVPAAAPEGHIGESRNLSAGVAPAVAAAGSSDRRRRLLIGAAAFALLGMAAGVGWLSGRVGELPSASAPPITPGLVSASASPVAVTKPDWVGELGRLDAARSAAFAAADPSKLAAVYVTSSPLLVADRQAVERLRTAGQRAPGVRHAVRSAVAVSYDGRVATLRVVDELAAYELTDATGLVLWRAAPRGPAMFIVTLIKVTGGWRVQSLAPA